MSTKAQLIKSEGQRVIKNRISQVCSLAHLLSVKGPLAACLLNAPGFPVPRHRGWPKASRNPEGKQTVRFYSTCIWPLSFTPLFSVPLLLKLVNIRQKQLCEKWFWKVWLHSWTCRTGGFPICSGAYSEGITLLGEGLLIENIHALD